jgi:hypothetical protein
MYFCVSYSSFYFNPSKGGGNSSIVSLLANMYLQETLLGKRTIDKGENGGKRAVMYQAKDVAFKPVRYLYNLLFVAEPI